MQDQELLYACQERFAKTEDECQDLFNVGSKENEMLPFVDDECEIIDSEILEVMAKRDVNLFEDEADNTKSMLARQYRLALWTMYKRTRVWINTEPQYSITGKIRTSDWSRAASNPRLFEPWKDSRKLIILLTYSKNGNSNPKNFNFDKWFLIWLLLKR